MPSPVSLPSENNQGIFEQRKIMTMKNFSSSPISVQRHLSRKYSFSRYQINTPLLIYLTVSKSQLTCVERLPGLRIISTEKNNQRDLKWGRFNNYWWRSRWSEAMFEITDCYQLKAPAFYVWKQLATKPNYSWNPLIFELGYLEFPVISN